MGDFQSLFNRLDPNPRRRGHQLELVCQWFLGNDHIYAARLRRVWMWKQWPDRWRESEAGIDLVAEDMDGKLWAIQSKAWAADRPIPKRELDKFLSESNRAVFSYRLLITTSAAGLHRVAAETVAAQEKPVLIVDLADLRKSPVDWPATLEDVQASLRAASGERPRRSEPDASCPILASTDEFVDALRVRDHGDPRWECWFGLLERYVAECGHARPPAGCKFKGQSLGRWVIHQRQLWRRGKLAPQRARALEALPGWTFNPYDAAWLDTYHELAKFVSVHGSPCVPADLEGENSVCIAYWIVNQRNRYRAGALAQHRVRLLEALPGWSWTRRAEPGEIRASRPART